MHTVVTHSVTAPVVETSFRAIEDAYLNDTLLLLLGKVSKNCFFRTLSQTMGRWGSKVLNFLVKIKTRLF